MNARKLVWIGLLWAAVGMPSGCEAPGRPAWTRTFDACGFASADMAYHGPVTGAGVGAVWRALPDGGYALTRRSDEVALPESVVEVGPWVEYAGGAPSSAPAAVVLPYIGGVTPELAAELGRAKSAQLRMGALREERLDPAAFTDWLERSGDDDAYANAVRRLGRVVTWRTVRVQDLSAVLTFDARTAARLRALLPSGTRMTSGGGGLGVPLELVWTSPGALELIAQDSCTVFSAFGGYDRTAAAFGRGLVPVVTERDARLEFEVVSPRDELDVRDPGAS